MTITGATTRRFVPHATAMAQVTGLSACPSAECKAAVLANALTHLRRSKISL